VAPASVARSITSSTSVAESTRCEKVTARKPRPSASTPASSARSPVLYRARSDPPGKAKLTYLPPKLLPTGPPSAS
jgi:hypothetical protein